MTLSTIKSGESGKLNNHKKYKDSETYFKFLIIIYIFRINKKFKDYLSCSK
jgi:hypothetical protein